MTGSGMARCAGSIRLVTHRGLQFLYAMGMPKFSAATRTKKCQMGRCRSFRLETGVAEYQLCREREPEVGRSAAGELPGKRQRLLFSQLHTPIM